MISQNSTLVLVEIKFGSIFVVTFVASFFHPVFTRLLPLAFAGIAGFLGLRLISGFFSLSIRVFLLCNLRDLLFFYVRTISWSFFDLRRLVPSQQSCFIS